MPARPLEPYNIPGARTPFWDPKTGLVAPVWYNFFYYISQSLDVLIDSSVTEAALASLLATLNANLNATETDATYAAGALAQQRQTDAIAAAKSVSDSMLNVQQQLSGILQRLQALEGQVSVDMARI